MKPALILLALSSLFAQQPPAATLPGDLSGAVQGRVVNAVNGEPIRKARIVLRSAAGNYATDADASGSFTIASVAPGDYEIVASRPRFGIISSADIPRFKLVNGQSVAGLVLRLTPLGAISGRILDSDNDPTTGASVEALQYVYTKGRQQLQSIQTVQINDRGEYRLFDLLPGRYYIRASSAVLAIAPGVALSSTQFTETFLGDAVNASRATPVDLPSGGDVSGADIRIGRGSGYAVRGRLIGGLGQVMIQKRVEQGVPSVRMGSPIQGSGDRFEFSGLTPGTWILRAQSITIDLQALNSAGQNPVRVVPRTVGEALRVVDIVDHDVDGADLTFAPLMEISGVVKAAGSVPVALANQRIQFQGAAGTSFDSALAADGVFAAHAISRDVYQVSLNPPANAYVQSLKLGDHEFPDRRLDLQQGGSGTLTITVSGEFGQIDGHVTGSQNAPAAGATVMLVPDQDSPDSYQTVLSDVQGGFSFNRVRPAHYRVFAWTDPPRVAPPDQMGASIEVQPNGRHAVELKVIGGN